jgi:multidrug resistance protein
MATQEASSPSPSLEKADAEKDTTDAGARRRSTAPKDDSALALLQIIETHDDAHPIHWSSLKKWVIVTIYCVLQVFVTLTSTTYVSAEFLIQERFGGSTQVITLGQSMFIVGNAVGPAFLGPLSDIGGRKWVYVGSIAVYAILNIGTALAINLPMLIIFQFLCGAAGSTALTNVAGTIADLFGDSDNAGQPMALFVAAANYGPSLGSPIGEWIADNANMGWRWIFYINIIIGGVFAFALIFVPETLPKVVISQTVKRHGSVDENAVAVALGSSKIQVLNEIRFIATMALRIMVTEPIVIFLAVYNGWAYGLLFLYLDGVFDVFAFNNGLSYVGASLTYLNFAVGVTITFLFVPVQVCPTLQSPLIKLITTDLLLQTRPPQARRPRPPRSPLPHQPGHHLALPHKPVLVRLHQQRQNKLLVPHRRRRRPRFRRPAPLPLHAELHHRQLPQRCGQRGRGILDPEFLARGCVCAYRDCDGE